MWFFKDDVFRIYDIYPAGIEKPSGTTVSSSRTAHGLLYIHHKDNKTPNIQKRHKCPEFRLSRPRAYKPSSRIQKSQIRAEKGQKRQMTTLSPYTYARKTLSQTKNIPKYRQTQSHVQKSIKTSRKPPSPKIYNKKNSEKYAQKGR